MRKTSVFSANSLNHIPGILKFRGQRFHTACLRTVLPMCGPQTAASAATNPGFGRPRRLTASEVLGCGLHSLCFGKPPTWLWFRFENHCLGMPSDRNSNIHFKKHFYLTHRPLTPCQMVWFVITGGLSTEMGPTVFPKLHVFQLFLPFAARLSCSGELAEPHQHHLQSCLYFWVDLRLPGVLSSLSGTSGCPIRVHLSNSKN